MKNRVSLNFSFNVPYGLTTDWEGDWEGRYEAVYTSLRCYFFVPSLAVKLIDHFSIGFGPQVVYADAEMKKAIQTPLGDVETKLTGNDWEIGWLISAIYKIKEHTSIGVVYRSQINLDINGNAKYYNVNPALSNIFRNGKGEVFLDLPDTLAVGISTNYFPHWILSFDLLWSGWGTYDQTCGAELPTDDRQLFNIGLGYRKKNLGIDFAYTYLIMEDSKPGTVTSTLSGEYEGNAHIFAFNIK